MRFFSVLFLLVVVTFSLIPAQDDIPGANDLFAWLAGIFLQNVMMGDKVAHFIAYASVTGATIWAQWPWLRRWYLLPLTLFVLSGVLERAQAYISVRSPDLLDMLANASGIFIGGVLAYVALSIAVKFNSLTT